MVVDLYEAAGFVLVEHHHRSDFVLVLSHRKHRRLPPVVFCVLDVAHRRRRKAEGAVDEADVFEEPLGLVRVLGVEFLQKLWMWFEGREDDFAVLAANVRRFALKPNCMAVLARDVEGGS